MSQSTFPKRGGAQIRFVPVVAIVIGLCSLGGPILFAGEAAFGRVWRKSSSPATLGWSVEKLQEARRYSESIDTAALMIVQEGVIVDEWGATALPLNCHSVRKSLLSALYGPHVASGRIDLSRTLAELGVNDNEPSLSESELKACLGDLLKARSGVYHPALYETKQMAASRPKRGSHEPNSFWYYNNWDFNAAGAIFEHLTGRSIFEEFEQRIAIPLGMEDFQRDKHTRYVTGKDSVYPAYPFQLSTRDLARFGLLCLNDGQWDEREVVPSEWIQESTTSYSDTGSSGGYGYMWWISVDGTHFPGVKLPAGSYSARGYRGQYLVVIPAWKLIVCHRVNSFQSGTAVSKTEFGGLLSLILAARPEQPPSVPARTVDATSVELDTLIRGGWIVDGTGAEKYRGDLGIRDGRLAAMGDLEDATAHQVIEAAGKFVAPGFIDLHSHADVGLVSRDPARRSAPNLITQGITTVVINQDGGGPLDLNAQRSTMERLGVGLNVVQLLGHGTLRREVMGEDFERAATQEELEQMQARLRAALSAGCFGMSAGLEYVPGRWSTPREMEALARVIAQHQGVYIVHERSSGSRPMWFLPSRDPADQPSMLDNLRELIEICQRTRVTTVATHIKARGTDFWGSSSMMNSLLGKARDSGLPLFADQYPYNTSGSDGRIVLIPRWATARPASSPDKASSEENEEKPDLAVRLESLVSDSDQASKLRQDIEYEILRRGGAENIIILDHPREELVGKTLQEFTEQEQVDPIEAAIRLQVEGDRTRRGGARLRAFSMSEDDVEAFAKTPWTATSSDAGIALPEDGPVHPRFYGAFPRKIRRYAIDRELMSVEEAVRVSTSLPAKILRLPDRGTLREGAVADIVVFDPARIQDKADAFNPHQYAAGIDYVFVNGKQATEGTRWLGSLPGQVLTRD